MITPIQYKIYQFIQQYIKQHGYSPSLTEVATGIGISPNSISLISRAIRSLVAAGKLKSDKRGYRNIELTADNKFTLPLMGRIAAGVPIEAIEDKQIVDLASLFKSDDCFVLQVSGNSMIEDGIFDGDLIICKRTTTAHENDIVVALIDNQEATLKHISYREKDRITLIPANSNLQAKSYAPEQVQIQGLFIGLLRLNKK